MQEALNNVWRHAAAKSARVTIRFNLKHTLVEIRDDGQGFVVTEDMGFLHAGKIGLAGMQERADLLGGSLSIQSEPGKGTMVTLTVPGERAKTAAAVSRKP